METSRIQDAKQVIVLLIRPFYFLHYIAFCATLQFLKTQKPSQALVLLISFS